MKNWFSNLIPSWADCKALKIRVKFKKFFFLKGVFSQYKTNIHAFKKKFKEAYLKTTYEAIFQDVLRLDLNILLKSIHKVGNDFGHYLSRHLSWTLALLLNSQVFYITSFSRDNLEINWLTDRLLLPSLMKFYSLMAKFAIQFAVLLKYVNGMLIE